MNIWKIPLFDSDIGDEETAAATKVLASKWLTIGEITKQNLLPGPGNRLL